MKKLFYILIFSFICFFSDAYAVTQEKLNQRCFDNLSSPVVTVKVSYDNLSYDFSESNRSLTRMHIQKYSGKVGRGRSVKGLTTYDLGMNVSFNFSMIEFADNAVCLYPKDIQLNISLKNPVIHISSDLQEGSCEFILTMRHEQTHHQITVDIINYYLPIIQERFFQTVKEHPFIGRNGEYNPDIAKNQLLKDYQSFVTPLLNEINEVIQREQAYLDTAEQYDYEDSLCR